MRRIRIVLAILLLAAASLLGTEPTSTAVPGSTGAPAPYGPAIPLVNCSHDGPADAAIASDGTVRAFANCESNGPEAISYVRYRGQAIFAEPTPYRGRVIKVAWDDLNSTYLLFARSGTAPTTEQLWVGKRLDNTGQYAPPTLLATAGLGGLTLRPIQASLVAYRSTWWAVWTEPTAAVSRTLTYSLFQRHTLLGVQPRTRITYPVTGADDSVPSLAYSPRSTVPILGLLTVLWLRSPYLGAPRAQLRFGQEFGHGWEMSVLPATEPTAWTGNVDHISYLGTRYLTWRGTHSVAVASIVNGFLVPHFFPTGGDTIASTVAVSGQNLFLLWWMSPGNGTAGPQMVLAERQGATWYPSATVSHADAGVRVLAQGGKGRLVYWSFGTLMLRIQS